MVRSVLSHLKRELGCGLTRSQVRSRIKLLSQTLKADKHDGMFPKEHIRDAENCIAALKMILDD